MQHLIYILVHILSWMFLVGLAGAAVSAVLFVAELVRSTRERTETDRKPVAA